MELLSLYYFTELAGDLHMTRTAERLHISQQTLSNHIARLEHELGVPLLYRKPSLSLTDAGEHVLIFASSVLKEHNNLKDILSDIGNEERGILRFGASTLRLNNCLPHVLPRFSSRYPQVEIRITDAITDELVPMVLAGQLDFAIALSGHPELKLSERHLMDDQVYLCVAESLLSEYYGEEAEALKRSSLKGAYIGNFSRLPFCLLSNRMGEQVNECFLEASVTPRAYITSSYMQINTTVCFERLAASFIPQASLADRPGEIPEDINIFPLLLRGEPLIEPLSLIRREDRYLPHFSRHFLDLLFQYYEELEHIRPERIV